MSDASDSNAGPVSIRVLSTRHDLLDTGMRSQSPGRAPQLKIQHREYVNRRLSMLPELIGDKPRTVSEPRHCSRL